MSMPGRGRGGRRTAPRSALLAPLTALLVAACGSLPPALRPPNPDDPLHLATTDSYLRTHLDRDFQAISSSYVHQRTQADCSATSTAILINALRQVSGRADGTPVSEAEVLAAVGDPDWARAVADNGEGVSFAAYLGYLRRSLDAFGFRSARIDVFHPTEADAATRERLRHLLADSAHSANSFLLAVFDQGTLTGGEHVGHVSPIATYDPARRRALILDVDRGIRPYWADDDSLLAAMLFPDATDPSGNGLVRVSLPLGIAHLR